MANSFVIIASKTRLNIVLVAWSCAVNVRLLLDGMIFGKSSMTGKFKIFPIERLMRNGF